MYVTTAPIDQTAVLACYGERTVLVLREGLLEPSEVEVIAKLLKVATLEEVA